MIHAQELAPHRAYHENSVDGWRPIGIRIDLLITVTRYLYLFISIMSWSFSLAPTLGALIFTFYIPEHNMPGTRVT